LIRCDRRGVGSTRAKSRALRCSPSIHRPHLVLLFSSDMAEPRSNPSTIFRPFSSPALAQFAENSPTPVSPTTPNSPNIPTTITRPASFVSNSTSTIGHSNEEDDSNANIAHKSPLLREEALVSDSSSHPPSSKLSDLGDDDNFHPAGVSGYITDISKGSALSALVSGVGSLKKNAVGGFSGKKKAKNTINNNSLSSPASTQDTDELNADLDVELDHRHDGIFDELDDIDGWVAEGSADSTTGTSGVFAKLNVEKRINTGLDRIAAGKSIAHHERAEGRRRETQVRDKMDRATAESVLDPKTRMILFRMLSRGKLRTLGGCISAGKEAKVFHGTAPPAGSPATTSASALPFISSIPNPNLSDDGAADIPVAVKVYATAILGFKDRERYVSGEFRFRRSGYNKSSSRQMVKQWAEKEYRNLIRLQEANIPCPVPYMIKSPVLVMSFFGRDGWPAPLLKDASLSGSKLVKAYNRVCVLMRRMYHVAKLVHGDLSEYNILYWNGQVIIIDVSQSTEHDHPNTEWSTY